MRISEMNKLKEIKSRILPYCWVMPAVIGMVGIMGYAWVSGFQMSLTDWRPMVTLEPKAVGFANYAKLFRQPLFRHSLLITSIFTIGSVTAQMVLGFVGALLLQKLRYFKGLARTITLLPMMLAPAVAGLIWKLFMDVDFGLLNYIFRVLGLAESGWIADRATVLPSVIMVEVWQWTPFVVLLLLAGLESLPREPYEAAELDGATRLQSMLYITIPLLRPILVIVLLFRLTFTLRAFDTLLLLARGGGPGNNALTVSMYLYERAYVPFNLGMTAAVSYVILGITVLVGAVVFGLTYRSFTSAS